MTALISNLIRIQMALLEGWWTAMSMLWQSGQHLVGQNVTLAQVLKL